MLTFALLSTFLILSTICTADDGFDSDSPSSTLTIIAKNIHGHASYIEPVFYGDFVQPLQRRLLEHPCRAKQLYRSHDYVARGHRPRNKLDESRSYRSSANDEDEDEDEEEDEEEEEKENQGDEENKLDDDDGNDESADEETAEQNEEETVAIAARNHIARSDDMMLGDEASERERREVMRIRSTSEECEDEPTEPSQYYEYETEVRNVASQDKRRAILPVKVIGASSVLILLFA